MLYARSQDGYTLVEVVIASAIGAILMTGLTSVILTSVRATNTATSRIEASSQIRTFQFFAADDFARSGVPSSDGCTVNDPCRHAIALVGRTPVLDAYGVTYAWDEDKGFLDRSVPGSIRHVATRVTDFSWYVDGQPPKQTVVVNLKVTVQDYSEHQVMRFYPRLQS
jgi:prepilin-type N-terminal cleavage/methylation domain-containing protein